MNSLYTQYHSILHGTSIPAMITIYTDDGTTTLPHTSTRPRRFKQNTNASSSPPRMINPLHLHLRLFLHLTPAPHTQPISILMPSLVLRFGINQFHSTEYRSDPTSATDHDITVLLYGMLYLVYTTRYPIPPNYPVYCLSLLVSSPLHYLVLFCLLIHSPWLKLMIDTLMNGMINLSLIHIWRCRRT